MVIRGTIKDIILEKEFFKITPEEVLLEIGEAAEEVVGVTIAGHRVNYVENLDTQFKNATIDLI